MRSFDNVTDGGNEKAIRRGRMVPEGDINLAYVKAPELTPKNNVVIVDTSRITEDNLIGAGGKCKLYYANPIGILVDELDNMVISDEYPIITDVFSVDEDFSLTPGSEYEDHHILPFKHTSRHFHLGSAGMTIGGEIVTYEADDIKVVDGKGSEYNNYRIKVTPAYLPGNEVEGDLWAYRVFAFVDTDANEDLYLQYNKTELSSDGEFLRRRINYTEILNPEPFFEYTPEESDVADSANRDKKIYSSKSVSYKDEVIGNPGKEADGYKVYVPKKALGDPRLYQLFRWRLKCTFKQDYVLDPSKDIQTIKCGVIVTSSDLQTSSPSRAPYALYNLAKSRFNAKNISFINPARENHSETDQVHRNYWLVNIDKDDLSQYDILLWAPNSLRFDFSKYAAKINDFVGNHSGTIFFDSNTYADPYMSLTGLTTMGIHPVTGRPRGTVSVNTSVTPVNTQVAQWGDMDHPVMNGGEELGGWTFMTSLEDRLYITDQDNITDYDGSAPVLRRVFAQAMYNFLINVQGYELPERRVGAFPDVTSRTQGREAIETLANTTPAIILGDGNGFFNPEREATRAQAASFLMRMYNALSAHFEQLGEMPIGTVSGYSDVDSNYVHADAIGRLAKAGIMVGYADGTFRPQATLNYRQVSLVFTRMVDYLYENAGIVSEVANNDDLYSMSYTQTHNRTYSQSFHTTPPGYTSLLRALVDGTPDTFRDVTVIRRVRDAGHKILSTFGHLHTCSALFSYADASLVSANLGVRAHVGSNYERNINSVGVEGAMKLLYNAALLAVRGKIISSEDNEEYSSTWTYSTPWRSSWVINASDGVLSEQEKSDHNFVIDAKDIHADPPDTTPLWKRRLANKTLQELMDESLKSILENPGTAHRVQGAEREYEIEVTNPYVEVGSKVVQNDYPYAWTEAYTPKFTVPAEIGPHVVRYETDEHGIEGKVAQYDNVTYVHQEYPDKPYAGQVMATYAATEEIAAAKRVNYTATVNVIAKKKVGISNPPTTTKVSDIELTWWDSQVDTRNASTRGGPLEVGDVWQRLTSGPHQGSIKAPSLQTWQDRNYYTSDWGPGHLNWPYIGFTGRIVVGSGGDTVRFVQEALNRFMAAGYFSSTTGKLKVDGVFGNLSSTAVRALQTRLKARYIDGVIDAETWSLIGFQIHRLASEGKLGRVGTDYTKWFAWHERVQPHRISNGRTGQWAAKRSWVSGGPSIIWELYALRFRESYNWHGLTIVPWVGGDANNMMVRSIHVLDGPVNLTNYNSERGQLKYMPHRPRDGQELHIPFGPYRGDTIIVGVGQDRSSGFGSSRMFGIRDIRGHAKVTSTTQTSTITHQNEEVTLTVSGWVDVDAFSTRAIQLQIPRERLEAEFETVSSITWTGITVDNPNVVATINSIGRAQFDTQIVATNNGGEVKKGAAFPGFTYHSMDENGRFNPVPETGWISKADGFKLLCDTQKRPVGFPSMPTNVGPNEYQRHYTTLVINTSGTDSSVQLGFYDVNRQEFITTKDGHAKMSYLEYVKRGPHNVYVAVISDYESTEERVIPVDEDAPRLPYRWAMPVYGVCVKTGSQITLEPLPDRLGPTDLWPIAVRDGKFSRKVKIRKRRMGGLTGYLGSYQDSNVHAFYGLPEADMGGYSPIYGPPNTDIRNEEPLILDDSVIQVKQAPILMEKFPTQNPNHSDPVRPVLRLYKRQDRTAPWIPQPLSSIRDYNSTTGEIHLVNPLTSNDAGLLRVDYTSTRKQHYFKRFGDTLLNLNSYAAHSHDLIGEAIYVYLVPHYVKDDRGRVIEESVQERTLRMSLSTEVFDPLRPEYNPLAVLLGVVYISTALDLDDLGIIDTRRRGGGMKDGANVDEVSRLVADASMYWDVGYGAGESYQKTGYVVVRLPEELKNEFSEDEITTIIQRNMTSGVGFKIEDLHGGDWS